MPTLKTLLPMGVFLAIFATSGHSQLRTLDQRGIWLNGRPNVYVPPEPPRKQVEDPNKKIREKAQAAIDAVVSKTDRAATQVDPVKEAYESAARYIKPWVGPTKSALEVARDSKTLPKGYEWLIEAKDGRYQLTEIFVQDLAQVSRYTDDEQLSIVITDLLALNSRR